MNNSNNTIFSKTKLRLRPLPSLKETEKYFLSYLKAFGNENKKEIELSEIKLKEFINDIGDVLQKRLIDRNKISPGWLHNLIEQENLKQRDSISINGSYYILYDFGFKSQIDAVAKLILCSIKFKNLIRDNKIELVSNKCPMQFLLLFHSCISPELDQDKLLTFDYAEKNNVIILYKNNFWIIKETLEYEKICEQLTYIIAQDVNFSDENFIGFISTAERNKYTSLKEKFIKISKKNKDFFNYIQESMIIFSLEQKSSADLDLKEINNLCWFNEGRNRFHDKLFQFIVLRDGLVSMNAINGYIDKSTCLEFSKLINEWTYKNEISNSADKFKFKDKDKEKDAVKSYFENFSNKPLILNYDLDAEIISSIQDSKKSFSLAEDKIQTDFLFFNEYGKEIIQRKGLDPIAYIQTAVLAAYYRVYGEIVASREFVCGRNFSHGVSEWIRTTTSEVTNFSISLNETKMPRDLKIKLGLDAFKAHKQNTFDILNGKSIDIHFLSLASFLEKNETVYFFEDYMYKKSSKWIIDFYPVSSNLVKLCAYPPPNVDGISFTYIMRKDQIQFIGVSYNNLSKFSQALIEVLREMRDLFIEKERDILRSKF